MLQGIITLVALQLLGETISFYFDIPIPGAIIGMVLLLGYLMLRGYVSRPLAETSGKLFPYLPLLLIPASVGVIQYGTLLEKEGIAVLAALVISLVISFIATPFIFRFLSTALKRQPERTDDGA